MKTLAFDGRMGASGDMFCAALVAAGAEPAVLDRVADALGVRYAVGSTIKSGIEATTVDVLVDGNRVDDHDHDHDHDHAEGHGPNRTFAEVVSLVENLDLSPAVEDDALGVFRRLGEAEASVHGTDLDDTHFHEVGADDAVADVVGACLLLADLDVERVVTTPVSAGGGTVEMSHGVYPVPAPAVAEIAADADWSLRGGPVDRELLTPTGAALLAEFADGVATLPPLDAHVVGYGAGDADVPARPNVLRVLVGDGGGGLRRESISVLETNVDDVSPEVLGSLQESLAEDGAHDVSIVPTTMKKSRPGHLITVVVDPADAHAVARRLAEETGTLGVRESSAGHRWVAERAFETARLAVGGESYELRVKVGRDGDGAVYDVSAEYDDALAVARETDLPVREVMRRAEAVVADDVE